MKQVSIQPLSFQSLKELVTINTDIYYLLTFLFVNLFTYLKIVHVKQSNPNQKTEKHYVHIIALSLEMLFH